MPAEERSVDQIFDEAIRRPGQERAAFLDVACGQDSAKRQRVERLLQAHFEAGSFLESPAGDLPPTMDQPVLQKTGSQIGPYKLLQQIGEGGMGVVYMAEQTTPVERRVALKIIKPGMDSRQVIARFEAERQALALMDHPNIAKVLEAATTDSGRPYFVMELVRGVPITTYCDEQHLTARERLALFIPVCQAVQHAHQKGLIHRDLKPSNVLVALYDGEPIPKVIDFGVAKATSQKLTEKTMFTQYGQIVGTLEYMSPEQAQVNQLDIDTRSDIYSLGVLLYELLTGVTPFDRQRLRSAAFDEMLRIVREEEPPRPSMRLSTIDTLPSVAANRRIEPQKLRTLVRGELDWIVMKALEKDRARRYETANGFAADIQHYLDDEPVVACPPSTAYRFRKFARRNKVLLSSATLISLALIVGAGVAIWQAVVATSASLRAEEAASKERLAREQAVEQALVATRAREETEEKGRQLEQQLRVAHATRLAAQSQALYEQSPELSMLLAIEGVRTTWRHGESIVPVAHETLLNRVAMTGGRRLPGHPNPTAEAWETVLSLGGKWLATRYLDLSGLIVVWDMTARDPAQTRRLLHHQENSAIAVSGRWLATGSGDGTLRLWDLGGQDPAAPARTFEGHDGRIESIAFSPDGRWLATGSADTTARLWDLSAPDPDATVRVLRGHEREIRAATISPDGRRLATGSVDATVRLWDLGADDPSATSVELPGKDHPNFSDLRLIWAPNSRWLVTLPSSGVPILRDLESSDPLSTEVKLGDGTDKERHVENEASISPDSRWLVTTASDNTARLWDLSVKDVAGSPRVLSGHIGMITSLTFSPDSRWLATGSRDRTARLWDLTMKDPASSPVTLSGHRGSVSSATFSPDARWLVTAARSDSTARLWNLTANDTSSSPQELRGHAGGIRATLITPDGRWLVTQPLRGGMARLWDLTVDAPSASPLQLRRQRRQLDQDPKVLDIAASPSGRWLVVARDASAQLWDISSVDPPTTPRVELPLDPPDMAAPWILQSSVAISPDEHWLATVHTADREVRLWDLQEKVTPSSPAFVLPHDYPTNVVAFSSSGRWLITGSGRDAGSGGGEVGEARVWDLNAHDPTRSPLELKSDDNVQLVAISSDERWLAFSRRGGKAVYLSVWDLKSGVSSPVRHFIRRGPSNTVLSISPDNRWLVAGAHVVRVWELNADGLSAPPRELKHANYVWDVCWTPDSGRLVSASGKDVVIWNFATEGPTSIPLLLYGHTGEVNSAVISPDGHWLVTGSRGDKTFRIWDLEAVRARDDLPVLRIESENQQFDGNVVRIWEPRPEDPASLSFALRGHEFLRRIGGRARVAFSGAWLVTGGISSVRLWDWDVNLLLDRASRLAGREMTIYERQYSPRYGDRLDLLANHVGVPSDKITVLEPAEVDEMVQSNVGLARLAVPDTKNWKAFIQDDFERSGIGEQWKVVSGEWSIEDGRLRCTLTSPGALHRSEARIEFVGGEMPKTLEVECDTLGSADVSSQLRLMNKDSSNGYVAELCGFPRPGLLARLGRKGTGPLLWVVDADNPPLYEFIGDAPQFEYKPNRRCRFQILREPNRITWFVDGKQVLSERVTPLEGSVLQLYGFGASQDRVYFDNLRVRVPNH